jgi:hypothetical protein
MPVSGLRRFHAWFLDISLLSIPLHLIMLATGLDMLFGPLGSTIVLVPVCCALPIFGLSPGRWILSVDSDGSVDSEIHSGENWLTLLLGFIFVQWGCFTSFIWTQLESTPFFGTALDPAFGAAASTTWGLLTIFVGVLFYKLAPAGLWLGIVVVLINAADLFLSREGWIDIHLTRFFANQPPNSPFAGGTFSAPTVAAELTPIISIVLGTGTFMVISLMLLASRRLTRTA